MKNYQDRWEDKNGNQWLKIEFRRQDIKELKTCLDCLDSTKCEKCTYCYDCIGCDNCINCKRCFGCKNCRNCQDCYNCADCDNCFSCRFLVNCDHCSDFKIDIFSIFQYKYIVNKETILSIIINNQNQIVVRSPDFVGPLEQFEKNVVLNAKLNLEFKMMKDIYAIKK